MKSRNFKPRNEGFTPRACGIAIWCALVVTRSAFAAEQSKFADVNGIRMHYLVSGKGDPIVLLHGYAETSHMWLPLMTKLQGAHTVIAPDLRGAGDSEAPDGGYTKANMAEDIHALVQSLGLREVSLVGHDIGLMVAYAYAAQHPQEVKRIALMDAFLPGIGAWRNVWLLRDKWHFNFYGETPLRLVQGRERIYLDHFWNDFAARPEHSIPESDRRLYTKAYAQPGHMKAGFEYFHAFTQDAADFEMFAKTPLGMPMLVLSGQQASGSFLIEQARLVDSDVQAQIIKGSGHWLMEEAPDQTIPALINFLTPQP